MNINNKPINVWISPASSMAAYEVWVTEMNNNSFFNLHLENGDLKKVQINETEGIYKTNLTPFMVIPMRLGTFFFPELINAINRINIHSEQEATIKGTLVAKEAHLEDMRKTSDNLFSLLQNLKLK